MKVNVYVLLIINVIKYVVTMYVKKKVIGVINFRLIQTGICVVNQVICAQKIVLHQNVRSNVN